MIYYAPTEQEETAPLVKDARGRYWERLILPLDKARYCSHPRHTAPALFLSELWRCIATRFVICDDCLKQREDS